MASKSNINTKSSSKPSTTASRTSNTIVDTGEENGAGEEIEESKDPTNTVDPSVLPLTNRHTSEAWASFTRKKVGKEIKAECKNCSKLLAGGPRAGTSHLKRACNKCLKRKCMDIRQTRLFGSVGSPCDTNETLTLAPYEFRQEDGRRDLAEMIVLHEYPLSIVEHYGFRKYSKTLQLGFKVPCRNTTKNDILQRYKVEKEKIIACLRKVKGRVAMTTDMWTANHQKKGYMAVTAHFIDSSWKLQSRIIRFHRAPYAYLLTFMLIY
ncbi:zinc finger BED domain-containing protein DAYSLEEPER-like [Spinacia oleracea]|uniref:Zinc finger BED domain-containing protein DAYSLEEPER-like n=1 Tax=Spinacia oleracea TaxID=3562 RepID=A0ABM3R529_SPIOL|nr:zinc finger BED domain-containing protein DAYSLEEPER-like [Spinacia oleracea]